VKKCVRRLRTSSNFSAIPTSIVNRDYPTIQALTLLFGVSVVVINLITDLIYAWLDPRVRPT